MPKKMIGVGLLAIIALSGCATLPTGPSVAVFPAPGKSFNQFAGEEQICRDYASHSIGVDVNQSGAKNVVTGAAVGTAVGAASGALLGGRDGAGTGAGIGLLGGSVLGLGNAGNAQRETQRRYDIAYSQCMYAKGNQLPQVASTTSYYYGYPPRSSGHQPVVIYKQPPPVAVIQNPVPQAAPPPSLPPAPSE